MNLTFCTSCQKYHAEGMCADNPWGEPPAPVVDPWATDPEPEPEPQPPLIPKPEKPTLSAAVARWTKTYERHLEEFASETNGIPTKAHVRRAEQLADREMREGFRPEGWGYQ